MTAAPALLPSLHALVEKWRKGVKAWNVQPGGYFLTQCADELEALLSRAATTQAGETAILVCNDQGFRMQIERLPGGEWKISPTVCGQPRIDRPSQPVAPAECAYTPVGNGDTECAECGESFSAHPAVAPVVPDGFEIRRSYGENEPLTVSHRDGSGVVVFNDPARNSIAAVILHKLASALIAPHPAQPQPSSEQEKDA